MKQKTKEYNFESLTGKPVKLIFENEARAVLFFQNSELVIDKALAENISELLYEFAHYGN